MVTPGKPKYKLYQWMWTGLDWLYPPSCGGCGESGSRWCTVCRENTKVISNPICQLCGRMLYPENSCRICKSSPPLYDGLRSWAIFEGPIRKAIHRLKYQRDVALGEILARSLIDCLKELEWRVDMITPVPLGVARRAERGYNQAALLARPIALRSNITYSPKSIQRVRETRSQVGLTSSQRQENVANAFLANHNLVNGKRVLLVDDVTTSGATLNACTVALLDGGADCVYCLTLARAA